MCIFFGHCDGHVTVWDTNGCTFAGTLQPKLREDVICFHCDVENSRIYAGGDDDYVRCWSVPGEAMVRGRVRDPAETLSSTGSAVLGVRAFVHDDTFHSALVAAGARYGPGTFHAYSLLRYKNTLFIGNISGKVVVFDLLTLTVEQQFSAQSSYSCDSLCVNERVRVTPAHSALVNQPSPAEGLCGREVVHGFAPRPLRPCPPRCRAPLLSRWEPMPLVEPYETR